MLLKWETPMVEYKVDTVHWLKRGGGGDGEWDVARHKDAQFPRRATWCFVFPLRRLFPYSVLTQWPHSLSSHLWHFICSSLLHEAPRRQLLVTCSATSVTHVPMSVQLTQRRDVHAMTHNPGSRKPSSCGLQHATNDRKQLFGC